MISHYASRNPATLIIFMVLIIQSDVSLLMKKFYPMIKLNDEPKTTKEIMTKNYSESDIIQLLTNRKNWWIKHLAYKAPEQTDEIIKSKAVIRELNCILDLIQNKPIPDDPNDELKPCPFCGSSNIGWVDGSDHNFVILCHDCGAQTPECNEVLPNICHFQTHDEAKNFWNNRN
jgi:hypothetical protein